MPNRYGHRRPKPLDIVERTALHRARQRQADEAALISVDCRVCGQPLAVVLLGAEAYCRPCGTWTSSLAGNPGVLG